jgi:hypothetical protein
MTYLDDTIVRLVIESEPKGMSVDEITEAITRLARTDAKLKQELDAENLKTLKLQEREKRKFKREMK